MKRRRFKHILSITRITSAEHPMSDTMAPNSPSTTRKPTWTWRRKRIVIALCLIGGCVGGNWWLGQSPKTVTVTVTVLDDTTQQPIPNVIVLLAHNPMPAPPILPLWMRGLYPFSQSEQATTDAAGQATFQCPDLKDLDARMRYQMPVVLPPQKPTTALITFSKALTITKVQGTIFHSDQIVIWLGIPTAPTAPPIPLPPGAANLPESEEQVPPQSELEH